MTDQTPGPELTPEEIERLRERLAVPAAPADVVDRARASALSVFDDVLSGADTTAGGLRTDGVRDIGSAGSARRQAWYQRMPLGAAAAILAVIALVGAFTQVDLDSGDDDTASADLETSAEAFGDADDDAGLESEEGADGSVSDDAAGLDSGGSGAGAPAPAAGEASRAVVVYPDIDTLVEDYRRRFDPAEDQAGGGGNEDLDESTASTTSVAADYRQSSCDAVTAAGAAPDRVIAQDPVLLATDGDQTWAVVVVYRSETNSLRVAVVDDESCLPLEDRAL